MAELVKGEALKAEKVEKEQELQQLTETSGASGHQKLRVCDICGAYLSILDSDRRLADHFGGKVRTSRRPSVGNADRGHRCISGISSSARRWKSGKRVVLSPLLPCLPRLSPTCRTVSLPQTATTGHVPTRRWHPQLPRDQRRRRRRSPRSRPSLSGPSRRA